MRGSTLDEIDYKLLELLQQNARMSQHDLSEAVGLSSPATGERLRKLEERGVIRGFTAILEPKLLGRDVSAFIAVASDGSRYYPEFVAWAREHPEILDQTPAFDAADPEPVPDFDRSLPDDFDL